MTGLPRALLDHLRAELRDPGLGYAEPPAEITGGYDTRIFGFRLSGAPGPFSSPLVLRVLGSGPLAARILFERTTQNTVADLGYPAPRVLLACPDRMPLGGPFLVMERLPGRPLLQARWLGGPSVLLEMQLRLHALDAEVLLQAFDRDALAPRAAGAPSITREMVTFEGNLVRLADRIARGGLRGLQQAMAWLVDHRPAEPRRYAICHGDFHPANILMADGRVTGVIDWPNAVVADPAFDVASTRVILGLVPAQFLPVPPALRGAADLARRVLVARHVRRYRRRQPLDATALAYFEALACVRGLVRVAEARVAAAGGAALNPLDASAFGERLGARFARITGVTPRLPAAPLCG
jgi:prepilin-type processing-associated H-X9-DG protein